MRRAHIIKQIALSQSRVLKLFAKQLTCTSHCCISIYGRLIVHTAFDEMLY